VPHQYPAVFVGGHFKHFDEFALQGFEIIVVEVKLALQRPIRNSPTTLKHIDGLP
jgi:hypothetical protein